MRGDVVSVVMCSCSRHLFVCTREGEERRGGPTWNASWISACDDITNGPCCTTLSLMARPCGGVASASSDFWGDK